MSKTYVATSGEEKEKLLVGYAIDLAEQQLRNGTASPSVITHYLKLGTSFSKLEREKLERENELLKAKTENLRSMVRIEEIFNEAFQAKRRYAGEDDE